MEEMLPPGLVQECDRGSPLKFVRRLQLLSEMGSQEGHVASLSIICVYRAQFLDFNSTAV